MAAESKKVTPRRSRVGGGGAVLAAAWNIASAVDMSTSPVTVTTTRSPATSPSAEKSGSAPS